MNGMLLNGMGRKADSLAKWRIGLVVVLSLIAGLLMIPGCRVEASVPEAAAKKLAVKAQSDKILSSNKMYQLYSEILKKKKLSFYNDSEGQPVEVYVHDVNHDGIPEVIIGYYVFTIYNGKAVLAGCGAAYKGGSFCYWSFGDGEDQMGVSNTIDLLATFRLTKGKLVRTSFCGYGVGEEAEAKWNAYAEQFRKKFPEKAKSRECKTMKSVLRYIKKNL